MNSDLININTLATEIHARNKAKGFYEEPKNIGEMLCLIHSEVSEALEADRHNVRCDNADIQEAMAEPDDERFKNIYNKLAKGTFEEEMADIIIRVMDLSAFRGIDLSTHIKAKMRYNELRPYKHGKNY